MFSICDKSSSAVAVINNSFDCNAIQAGPGAWALAYPVFHVRREVCAAAPSEHRSAAVWPDTLFGGRRRNAVGRPPASEAGQPAITASSVAAAGPASAPSPAIPHAARQGPSPELFL
ncbi:hypothetical protein AAFF_G00154870 [Aldrovandia affinis]|uniref:Uncharacterized protein n=1 Tax=Aldrovandia affinis TaxID=143900 RepID=A0AAD7SZX6_9TELE|nr:hypothetical protein AAFF_G00154870 [Aldrovandia affinis]